MSFLGKLFGWDRVDERERKATELAMLRQAAVQQGWLEWWPVYSQTANPYLHELVWIWRPEWSEVPHLTSPRDMDPLMNVNGLFWKPAMVHTAPQSPSGVSLLN